MACVLPSEPKLQDMKISKNILQAMAIGLAMGTVTTACDTPIDSSDEVCIDKQELKADSDKVPHDFNCPACGMG